MTIEEALRAKLVAVVGHELVYPDGGIPQKQSKQVCITYQQSDSDNATSLTARLQTRIDSFTLEIVAQTRSDAASVREQLLAAFAGYNARGLWAAGVYVTGAVVNNSSADADDPFDASESQARYGRLTIRINWRAV